MFSLGTKAQIVFKKLDVTNVSKTPNFEGFDSKSHSKPFKQCSRVQIFCFFAERSLMHSSYMLWNKFQDYRIRFVLTNHFFGNSLTA